ncbi:MAG: sigma-70 family RNA polymerase sigma factor [Gammaproteobacteria bacterium]|jgi:RNA polymerase sigma-70 factor (ECF subfamily)
MPDEAELVVAAQAGSETAFTALVERYQDRLYRFLLGRCARTCDAEDVLQDTFVNAWRYIGSYDPRWRFSTWLYRIALRNAAAHRPVTESLMDDPVDTAADPLADCVAASERRNLWLAARTRLRPEVYTALWLHYADDLPVRDVARVMGRSVPWVKVSLHRARRQLAGELDSGEDG